MVGIVPDTGAFVDAQARLRGNLGCPVIFHLPTVPKWPEGTKLNPTTNLPYDATIQPEGEVSRDVTKMCLIILKQGSPLRPQSDTDVVALGEVSGMDIIVDIAASDYNEVAIADGMRVNTLEYAIREAKPFALGGVLYRWLVYGEER